MSNFPTGRTMRIGTRSSPMARAQVEQVAAELRKHEPGIGIEIVPVTTEADLWQGNLADVGGKGLFVKQIDQMLQRGDVDMAVHCVKDIPGDVPLPDGLVLAACLPRDDVRDILLVPEGSPWQTLDDLPSGAAVGTSAVRRRAQLHRLRPDLRVVRVRGALGTRVEKLDGRRAVDVPLDAMVAATAGLERIGLRHRGRQVFTVDQLPPAVGAGALALESRGDDSPVTALLDRLGDARTMSEITAERAMLGVLRGHCNSPVAGHCVSGADGLLTLRGMVFSEDGATFVNAHLRGTPGEDPAALGTRVGDELLRQGAHELIASIPH